jgi:hypothetical protein
MAYFLALLFAYLALVTKTCLLALLFEPLFKSRYLTENSGSFSSSQFSM